MDWGSRMAKSGLSRVTSETLRCVDVFTAYRFVTFPILERHTTRIGQFRSDVVTLGIQYAFYSHISGNKCCLARTMCISCVGIFVKGSWEAIFRVTDKV